MTDKEQTLAEEMALELVDRFGPIAEMCYLIGAIHYYVGPLEAKVAKLEKGNMRLRDHLKIVVDTTNKFDKRTDKQIATLREALEGIRNTAHMRMQDTMKDANWKIARMDNMADEALEAIKPTTDEGEVQT